MSLLVTHRDWTPPLTAAGAAEAAGVPAIAALTTPGRVGATCEDGAMFDLPRDHPQASDRGMLVAVADGRGGPVPGEMASSLVLETIRRHYYRDTASKPGEALELAARAAEAAVFQLARDTGGSRPAGVGFAALAIAGPDAYAVRTGNCRVYLIREGRVHRMNGHRSLRDILLCRSQLMSLARPAPLLPHDRLLLCTAGLFDHASEEEMARVTVEHEPGAACRILTEAVRRRGGRGDIAAAIVRIPPLREKVPE